MTTTSILHVLLAAGVFVALVPTGVWLCAAIAGRQSPLGQRQAWVLAIPVGVAVWSLPMTAAAYAGIFAPMLLGALGWVGALLAAVSLSRTSSLLLPQASRTAVATAIGLLALAALYASFPNESLLGNRDEGLYTLIALLLRRTGGMAVAAPAAMSAAPTLFEPFINGQAFFLPGIYQTEHGFRLQFAPFLPAWIAQFSAATGGYGLFRVSAAFALGSVAVFHVLARRFVRPRLAVFATVGFALNPAQVWISRINLVEPMAQLLVLGGLLASVIALERKSMRIATLAGALFGIASFGRLDIVMLSALTVGVLVILTVWLSERSVGAWGAAAALAGATCVLQLVATVVLAVFSPVYFADNVTPVLFAGAAVLAGLAALPLSRTRLTEMLRRPRPRLVVALGAAAIVVGLFVYAALVRPQLESFALIDRPGSALDGTRDFRERSLLNLAAYLSWPLLLVSVMGALVALGRTFRGRARAGLTLVAVISIAIAIVILANPRVSPDHFWGVRRFIPLAIPGVVLLAAYGLQATLLRVVGMRQRSLATLAALALGTALVMMQWSTIFTRENRGLTVQMSSVNDLLGGSSLLVVRGHDPLATTLFLGYARPVLPLRDVAVAVDASTRSFWSRCTREDPCTLVHRDNAGLTGLILGPGRQIQFAREFITPTDVPVAGSDNCGDHTPACDSRLRHCGRRRDGHGWWLSRLECR